MDNAPVNLQAKVDALRRPATYPGCPPVDVIETHMSWVFLAGDTAWKLKKPVRHEQLDFSTLEARHYFCMEELRLNRPLAASVYRDVVALVAQDDGTLRLGGAGTVVDWLVRMHRLSADLMLDRLLEQGAATAEHLRWVAQRLAGFYRGLEPAHIGPAQYLARLGHAVAECESELAEPACGLDRDQVRGLCSGLRSVLLRRPDLFEIRVVAGRIVEGHGDLRPDHIYLGTPPAIIDRLEFSMELRTLDTLDEIGYLALECERLGAPHLGQELLDDYRERAGDEGPEILLGFYQCLRACVRATLAIRHLREPQYRDAPKWPARARQYLELAGQRRQVCEQALRPLSAAPPAAP